MTTTNYPTVTPAPGAEALHRAHCERRPDRWPVRKRKHTHPDDHALAKAERDLVRFLLECECAGRVVRFHASPTPGRVVLTLAGPGGVFDPIDPVDVGAGTVAALAEEIAKGTAWQRFHDTEEIAA